MGATYELQKVAMTGDTVPDVSETFCYFRSVHMFPDGSVAFAGVTTRSESVQRNSPRGIYYAGVPGTLSTVAAIDDAEAWRSIGLPYAAMDSNGDKTFGFDFLQPSAFRV